MENSWFRRVGKSRKSYSQIQNQSRRNWTNNKDNSSARKGKKKKGVKDVLDHEHRIVPEKDAEGNVINFRFRSKSIKTYKTSLERSKNANTNHTHLVSVKEEESSNIPNQLTEHVLEQMRKTTDFRIMFEYCFNLQDISTLVAVYAYLANSTREALNMYNLPKKG